MQRPRGPALDRHAAAHGLRGRPAARPAGPSCRRAARGSLPPRPRMNSSVCVTMASISLRSDSKRSALLVVVQQFGAQPHARERRLQVVRQRGEHARAFVDEGRQPLLHGVEGARGLLHLARAVLRQGRAVEVLAQRLRRPAVELLQRPHDPAHGDVGQGQHAGQQHRQRQRQPPGQGLRCGAAARCRSGPSVPSRSCTSVRTMAAAPRRGRGPSCRRPAHRPATRMAPGRMPGAAGAGRRSRQRSPRAASTRTGRSSPSAARSREANICACQAVAAVVGRQRRRRAATPPAAAR